MRSKADETLVEDNGFCQMTAEPSMPSIRVGREPIKK